MKSEFVFVFGSSCNQSNSNNLVFVFPCVHFVCIYACLGTNGETKTDEILEKFQKFFNPKIYVAKFGPLDRAFSA